MPIREQTLLIDEAYFAMLFQFPTEGINDFSIVLQSTLEETKAIFSTFSEPTKPLGNRET